MGFSIAIACLFAIVALLIIGYFLKLVFGPLLGDPRTLFDRLKLRRKKVLLQSIDSQLRADQLKQAADAVAGAIFLDPLVPNHEILEQIANHHLEVLARIVTLSEKHSRHLAGLPVLEDLLLTRAELLRARNEVRQTKKGLLARRVSRGDRTPNWAMNEFSKKLGEINERLATNRRTIETHLRELIRALDRLPDSDHVTYH